MNQLEMSILAAQVGCTLDPFTFEILITPLLASSITEGQFLTQSDSGFAICNTSYLVTSTVNAAVAELQPFGSGLTTGLVPFLVTLRDSGSGRALSNIGVPIDNIFGTAQRPYIWPVPKILDANSAFVAAVENLSATDRRLRLSFNGFKIFGKVQNFMTMIRSA